MLPTYYLFGYSTIPLFSKRFGGTLAVSATVFVGCRRVENIINYNSIIWPAIVPSTKSEIRNLEHHIDKLVRQFDNVNNNKK